jgi:metal-sulfur cluster biosynthetic enzyme
MINQPQRLEEVWVALGTVTDPEIDEPVTALEFVSSVAVNADNVVSVEFRLPTFWCAPNFAFLMGSDMRDAVAELDWVNGVVVKLLDHFSADLINRGVALRQEFRDAFPGESDDDLNLIREKFLGKAFERRQELLMRYLLGLDQKPEWLTQARMKELVGLPLDSEGGRLRTLYTFAWRRLHPAWSEEDLAFVTLHGDPLASTQLSHYLRRVTAVRRNAEFNGSFCRSLLAERKADLRAAREDGNHAEPIGVSLRDETPGHEVA